MSGDAFETLGLEPRFAIARGDLDARHRDLSRALHPDRYAGAPASERRRALSEAINVNQAHRLLRDPVARAELVLQLALERAGSRGPADDAAQMAPDFLMQVMELRESLSEARQDKDLQAARRLATYVQTLQDDALTDLENVLDGAAVRAALDGDDSDGIELQASVVKARQLIGRLRYLRRFLEEVDAIEDDLD